MLFPPNIKVIVTVFQKSFLIYQFSCKIDICYIGRTTQRSDIRINQNIPTNIRPNTSGYSAAPSNQNSSFAIWQSELCSHKPIMFSILVNSNNEFQLPIQEALLITRHKPELCITKQFYTSLLFNNLIGSCKENIITRVNSSGLR